MPEPGNPQALNRYSYCLGNPLKYTDPSGHFSEEQLNWMGFYKNQFTTEQWSILLGLEPLDYIEGMNGGGVLDIWRMPGTDSHTLYLVGAGGWGNPPQFSEWLKENQVQKVHRDTPDGDQVVWENGAWKTNIWYPMLGQTGYVYADTFAGKTAEFLVDQVPFVGNLLDLGLYIDDVLGGQKSDGDFIMIFYHYDYKNDVVYSRQFWFSSTSADTSLVVNHNWVETGRVGPIPAYVEYGWYDTYYHTERLVSPDLNPR